MVNGVFFIEHPEIGVITNDDKRFSLFRVLLKNFAKFMGLLFGWVWPVGLLGKLRIRIVFWEPVSRNFSSIDLVFSFFS